MTQGLHLVAQSSALSYSIGVGNLSSENLTSSYSKLEDMDVQQYVSEKKKEQVMQQYNYFALTQQRVQQEDMVTKLLGV